MEDIHKKIDLKLYIGTISGATTFSAVSGSMVGESTVGIVEALTDLSTKIKTHYES